MERLPAARLMSKKRPTNQLMLAFMLEGESEAQPARYGGAELLAAKRGKGSPAEAETLMEEVCERANLLKALKRVKANRGCPGVDGMTVRKLTGYLCKHWPALHRDSL